LLGQKGTEEIQGNCRKRGGGKNEGGGIQEVAGGRSSIIGGRGRRGEIENDREGGGLGGSRVRKGGSMGLGLPNDKSEKRGGDSPMKSEKKKMPLSRGKPDKKGEGLQGEPEDCSKEV